VIVTNFFFFFMIDSTEKHEPKEKEASAISHISELHLTSENTLPSQTNVPSSSSIPSSTPLFTLPLSTAEKEDALLMALNKIITIQRIELRIL
jgi:hypothetical protein